MNKFSFVVLSLFIFGVQFKPSLQKSGLKLRTKEDELKKVPNFPVKDIDKLRGFQRSKSALPAISDLRLMQFHFSNMFKLDATEKTIETYYRLFKEDPEFFENRRLSEPKVNVVKTLVSQYISPTRTSDDSQIIFAKLVNSDYTNYNFAGALKYFFMAIEASTQLYGLANNTEVVIDYGEMSVVHSAKVASDVFTITKMVKVFQDALPIRAKAIHILNAGYSITTVVNVAKPFVSKELFEKVKVYTTYQMDEFKKNVPAKCLPEEYGGTLGPLESLKNSFEESMSVVEPFFAEEERLVKSTH